MIIHLHFSLHAPRSNTAVQPALDIRDPHITHLHFNPDTPSHHTSLPAHASFSHPFYKWQGCLTPPTQTCQQTNLKPAFTNPALPLPPPTTPFPSIPHSPPIPSTTSPLPNNPPLHSTTNPLFSKNSASMSPPSSPKRAPLRTPSPPLTPHSPMRQT